jgi:hypothetical protein
MAADQPDIDSDDGRDNQDIAEVFDEDNLDSDSMRLAKDDEELNFDNMPDVYDATSADGDEEDDDGLIGDDLSDDEIVEFSRQALDESDDDDEDEDFRASEDLEDDDPIESDEVDLSYAGDLNTAAGAHSGAQRYESRNLSDDDLVELGYKKSDADKTHEDEQLDSGLEETFPASDPVSVKHIT